MNNSIKILAVCILVILIGIGLSTISLSTKDGEMDAGLSKEDQMLYRFINRQGKCLEQKYQMRQSSVGLGGVQVWLMALSFHRFGIPLTEKEARKLIINCVDDFLEAVNSDEQVRPFLKDYPFTAKNVNLKILNYDKNHDPHYFPSIALVMNSEGDIGFLTEDPSDKYGYYTKKYETYDEAVAILKQKNKDEHSINK